MPAPEAKSLKVAVIGAAGYVGGEVLRLLHGHPSVRAIRAFSESRAGETFGAVHPSLAHVTDARLERTDPEPAARWADVVLLAMPHGRAQDLIDEIAEAKPKLVIDLAADFRIKDAHLHELHYGAHRAPAHRTSFVYGLADVAGASLSGASRIAVPGCFATATLLALHAFAKGGLIREAPTCVAATGSTGAGVEPKRTTHHPVRAHSYFGYSLDRHRHEGEIDEQMQAWTGQRNLSCRLLAHSAPLVRGIHATLTIPLARPLDDPNGFLRTHWKTARFVRVLGRPPELAAVVGTNFVHLHAVPREGGKLAVVVATIDNLVKGAAGQAVQAMNLALGIPEDAGLEFAGIYPC